MSVDVSDRVLAFDTFYTTEQIRMFKILLPYMQPVTRRSLTLYIKFMEFQHTMAYLKTHDCICPGEEQNQNKNVTDMMEEILAESSGEQQNRLKQFLDLTKQMENMQEIMKTVQMMKELFPEASGDPSDLSDIIQSMFASDK